MTRCLTLCVCIAALMLQGCANYMYTSQMSALDSEGVERTVIIYWPKTDPLIGKSKAGPVMLLTECGVPIQFDQQVEGVVFRGNPVDDMFAEGGTPNVSEFECGRFTGDRLLVEIDDGPISFVVKCKPANDEFSAIKRSYIGARDEPYEIVTSSVVEKSFLGKTLDGPDPPDCGDHN